MDGAEADRLEARETRRPWRRAADDLARLDGALEPRLHGFEELEHLKQVAAGDALA